MNIIKDFRNELLNRREVQLLFNAESNPGFEDTKKKLAEKFKANEENIVVNNVLSKFGSNSFFIEALLYDSKEHKEKIEPKKKKKNGN
jgi:ribosomal protein S24E